MSLCEQIKKFVPPWMVEPAEPYLCAMAVAQADSRATTASMFDEVEPGTASGLWLDLLGQSNFGIRRLDGETDARYRERILTPARAVTEPKLLAITTDLLALFGYGPPTIVPWYEGGHFLDQNSEFDTVADVAGGLFLDFSHLPMINGFEIYVDATSTDAERRELGALLAERVALGCRFQILPDDTLPSPPVNSQVVTEALDNVITEAADPIVT
jgi:hypothetical protein